MLRARVTTGIIRQLACRDSLAKTGRSNQARPDLFGAVLNRMHTVLQRLQEIFSTDRIANSVAHFAPRLVIALVVFLAFYLLYRLLNFLVARITRRARVEP